MVGVVLGDGSLPQGQVRMVGATGVCSLDVKALIAEAEVLQERMMILQSGCWAVTFFSGRQSGA